MAEIGPIADLQRLGADQDYRTFAPCADQSSKRSKTVGSRGGAFFSIQIWLAYRAMTVGADGSIGPGSLWLRWEPHVHAPGTIFNDQFKGDWDAYLNAIEGATPAIRALGVTDYYGLELYKEVRARKEQGRLKDCDLIFPNIELRFSVGTARSWINAHLLVCPDDPEHLDQLTRFLQRLTFKTSTDTFACNPSELIRLGRSLDPKLTDGLASIKWRVFLKTKGRLDEPTQKIYEGVCSRGCCLIT
jgi:hypothetical protein